VVGDFFGAGSLNDTPGALRFIEFESKDELRFDLRQAGGSLSGSLFELPAGELKLALGAEYREESGFAKPDSRRIAGDVGGNARSATRGSQIIREAFFEAQLPVLRGLPAAEELTLEVSGRYTDYSSFGGRYLSRYAFSYAPLDVIRLRGVYATSFRSPGISDLFLGSADSFVAVRDRCEGFPNVTAGSPEQTERLRAQCAAQLPQDRFSAAMPFAQRGGVGTQIRANVGGNRDLQEETATTMGFGLVFSPPWIPDLELSVDYYDVDIDDPIVGQAPQERIDDCLIDLDQSDCDALRRDGDGVLSFIDARRTNFGKIQTNGYDFGLRYRFELPVVGTVGVDFEGNYVVDFEVTSSMTETINGMVGTPNFKGRLATVINPTQSWELQATARYFGEVEDETRKELGLPFDEAPGVTYLDLSTSYAFGAEDKYNLTFGVNNAMDREPPRLLDGVTNTNTSNYDPLGRRFFASFRTRF
jgi:iron complex outermembrane receptor protein